MTRAGILGTGGIGAVHASQYRKIPDVEILAYDANPEKLASFCERFAARPMKSGEQLVEHCEVVDICLPTDLHLPWAVRAIEAGKPVLVEKPMAGTVEDCATMIDAAQKASVPLMPAQAVRFFPEFAKAKQLVESGRLGKPAVARTRRGGKTPLGEGGWFRDFNRSGGVLLDLAVHDFDWLRWTLGEVESVYARSALASNMVTIGDYALVSLRFESGAIAHVEATWLDPGGFRATFEICGSEGMVEYDSRLTQTLHQPPTANRQPSSISPLLPHDDPFYLEIRAFLDCVAAKTPPPVSGQDGLAAVAIARASMESAQTGKSVRPIRT